jgi:hypothetical protein
LAIAYPAVIALERAAMSSNARIAFGMRVCSATVRTVVMSIMSLMAGIRAGATFWLVSPRGLSIAAAQMRRWTSSAATIDRSVASSSVGVA